MKTLSVKNAFHLGRLKVTGMKFRAKCSSRHLDSRMLKKTLFKGASKNFWELKGDVA